MRSRRLLPTLVVLGAAPLVLAAAACSTVIGIRTYDDEAPPDAHGSNGQMDSAVGNDVDGTMLLSDGGQEPMPDGDSTGNTGDADEGDDASDLGDDAGPLTDASFPGMSDAMVTDAGCPPTSYCALVLASKPSFYFRFDDLTSVTEAPLDWSGNHTEMAWAMPASLGAPAPDAGGTQGLRLGTSSGTSETGAGFTLYYPDGGQAPVLSGVAPFTIEFWYQLDANATAEQYILTTFGGASPTFTGYRFFINSAKVPTLPTIELQLCHGACASTIQPGLARGTYQHIAATYDGATIIVYLNGVHATSTADVKGVLANAKHPASTALYGTIDELAIYPTALTNTVITKHANFPN